MPDYRRQSATGYRPWTTTPSSLTRFNNPDGDKTPKAEADYTLAGTEREHCSLCTYFVSPHGQNRWGQCTEVSGKIMSGAWCRFFKRP